MTLRFTILGCGSSAGVPRVGGGWGACDPNNPKNRRRRCSLLVERRPAQGKSTVVLVDTSPDLREQLIDAEVKSLDAVVYTHDHADHTHGIDDLRPLVLHQRRRIDVYMDERTTGVMLTKFGYCFETPPGSSYPPIVRARAIKAGEPITITGEGGPLTFLPFLQDHGDISALGLRIGGLAYSSDVVDLPAASLSALEQLDAWIVDALRYTPHPSHFSVDDALGWIERIKPRRAILTNLHVDLDYDALRSKLPAYVEPAYDGMTINLPDHV
jgi:phosphoribosyl 1,2-cyclic phosphate phosphodiesterase